MKKTKITKEAASKTQSSDTLSQDKGEEIPASQRIIDAHIPSSTIKEASIKKGEAISVYVALIALIMSILALSGTVWFVTKDNKSVNMQAQLETRIQALSSDQDRLKQQLQDQHQVINQLNENSHNQAENRNRQTAQILSEIQVLSNRIDSLNQQILNAPQTILSSADEPTLPAKSPASDPILLPSQIQTDQEHTAPDPNIDQTHSGWLENIKHWLGKMINISPVEVNE